MSGPIGSGDGEAGVVVKWMVSILVLAAGGLAGCGGPAARDAGAVLPAVSGFAAGECPVSPSTIATPPASQPPVTTGPLVPAGVDVLLLCDSQLSYGLPSPVPTVRREITDRHAVDTWRDRFNALPVIRPLTGVHSCPIDDGSSIVAAFATPSGSTTAIMVHLRGCASAYTATAFRGFDTGFRDDLVRLTVGTA